MKAIKRGEVFGKEKCRLKQNENPLEAVGEDWLSYSREYVTRRGFVGPRVCSWQGKHEYESTLL